MSSRPKGAGLYTVNPAFSMFGRSCLVAINYILRTLCGKSRFSSTKNGLGGINLFFKVEATDFLTKVTV
jgi:hypothetical protein